MKRTGIDPKKVFAAMLAQAKMPEAAVEHRFHVERKWRFDYAWPRWKVALEVDGGVWTGGAHGRGTGIIRDQEKHNYAAAMGWLIIRCVPRKLATADTIAFVKAALERHGWTKPEPFTSNPNDYEAPAT